MTRRWADVAELIATQGLKGRFVARSVHGLPFLLEEGMEVDFVPPTFDGPRHVRVASVQHTGDEEYLVSFSKVTDRDTAEPLVGSHCLVSYDQLPEDFEELLRADSGHVSGYRVVDEALGMLGPVVEVREMPTQDLLVVERNGEDVLIPFVDEFIVDINEDEGIVRVNLPAGLVELNSSQNA